VATGTRGGISPAWSEEGGANTARGEVFLGGDGGELNERDRQDEIAREQMVLMARFFTWPLMI